jgi:hypothetical protein
MTEEGWKDLVWPIEARNLDEAKAIWLQKGFTRIRTVSREELEKAFPGYDERRKALKKENR